jgi:hypothetical protein
MKESPRNWFLLQLFPCLLDRGFVIGVDLASLGNDVGEAQTFIVISAGLACPAFIVKENYGVSDSELAITLGLPGLLAGAAFANHLGIFRTKKDKTRTGVRGPHVDSNDRLDRFVVSHKYTAHSSNYVVLQY